MSDKNFKGSDCHHEIFVYEKNILMKFKIFNDRFFAFYNVNNFRYNELHIFYQLHLRENNTYR